MLSRQRAMTYTVITTPFRIADRVIFMKEGRVYFEGTPEELKQSVDPELKNFIEGNSGKEWEVDHV